MLGVAVGDHDLVDVDRRPTTAHLLREVLRHVLERLLGAVNRLLAVEERDPERRSALAVEEPEEALRVGHGARPLVTNSLDQLVREARVASFETGNACVHLFSPSFREGRAYACPGRESRRGAGASQTQPLPRYRYVCAGALRCNPYFSAIAPSRSRSGGGSDGGG